MQNDFLKEKMENLIESHKSKKLQIEEINQQLKDQIKELKENIIYLKHENEKQIIKLKEQLEAERKISEETHKELRKVRSSNKISSEMTIKPNINQNQNKIVHYQNPFSAIQENMNNYHNFPYFNNLSNVRTFDRLNVLNNLEKETDSIKNEIKNTFIYKNFEPSSTIQNFVKKEATMEEMYKKIFENELQEKIKQNQKLIKTEVKEEKKIIQECNKEEQNYIGKEEQIKITNSLKDIPAIKKPEVAISESSFELKKAIDIFNQINNELQNKKDKEKEAAESLNPKNIQEINEDEHENSFKTEELKEKSEKSSVTSVKHIKPASKSPEKSNQNTNNIFTFPENHNNLPTPIIVSSTVGKDTPKLNTFEKSDSLNHDFSVGNISSSNEWNIESNRKDNIAITSNRKESPKDNFNHNPSSNTVYGTGSSSNVNNRSKRSNYDSIKEDPEESRNISNIIENYVQNQENTSIIGQTSSFNNKFTNLNYDSDNKEVDEEIYTENDEESEKYDNDFVEEDLSDNKYKTSNIDLDVLKNQSMVNNSSIKTDNIGSGGKTKYNANRTISSERIERFMNSKNSNIDEDIIDENLSYGSDKKSRIESNKSINTEDELSGRIKTSNYKYYEKASEIKEEIISEEEDDEAYVLEKFD